MDDILQKTLEGQYQIIPDKIAVASDGGTIAFPVINEEGDRRHLYIDRRGRSDTQNEFYEGSYPGNEGSIRLGRNDALIAKVEAALDAAVKEATAKREDSHH
jgi:hypothetical protein